MGSVSPAMRVAHAFVLASTAIVATCVIVTLALLSREPSVHAAPTLPPPAYLVPVIGPTHGFSLPDEPTVPCPRFDAASGSNDHAWIDPSGRRHQLRCGPNHAVTRTVGPDGVLGTGDDICFDTKASCEVSPPTPPGGL